MKDLPTLQEVIQRRATKRLEDDIANFRGEITRVCNRYEAISRSVEFPFTDNGDKAFVQNLFYKVIVTDKVKESLLPCYMRKEVDNMVEAIDRIPKVDEPESY